MNFRLYKRDRMKQGTIKAFLERFTEAERGRVDIELEKLDEKVVSLGVTLAKELYPIAQKFCITTIIYAMKNGLNVYESIETIQKIGQEMVENGNSEAVVAEGKSLIRLSMLCDVILEEIRVKDGLGEVEVTVKEKDSTDSVEGKSVRDKLK